MIVRKQNGMSLVGFLIVLAMVVFFVYLGMRVVPMYIEYYSVVNAMEGIADERGSANWSPYEIKNKLMIRIWISVTESNVKVEHVKVVHHNGVRLKVAYEVRKPVIYNLDIVASFDKEVVLTN